MNKCPLCKEYDWGIHRCKPQWLVLCEEWHGTMTDWDEATTVRSMSHEGAAIEFGELYDRDDSDYTLAYSDETLVVRVKPYLGDEVKEFTVRGEIEPTYTASETKMQPRLPPTIMIDPTIPDNEIHLINHEGAVVSRVVGIGKPE